LSYKWLVPMAAILDSWFHKCCSWQVIGQLCAYFIQWTEAVCSVLYVHLTNYSNWYYGIYWLKAADGSLFGKMAATWLCTAGIQADNQSINQWRWQTQAPKCLYVRIILSTLDSYSNQPITTYILRSVSSSGKISCVIKNNILVNPVLV